MTSSSICLYITKLASLTTMLVLFFVCLFALWEPELSRSDWRWYVLIADFKIISLDKSFLMHFKSSFLNATIMWFGRLTERIPFLLSLFCLSYFIWFLASLVSFLFLRHSNFAGWRQFWFGEWQLWLEHWRRVGNWKFSIFIFKFNCSKWRGYYWVRGGKSFDTLLFFSIFFCEKLWDFATYMYNGLDYD